MRHFTHREIIVPTVLTATTLPVAERELAAADAVMASLIKAHAPCKLRRTAPPFHVLLTSIVNQQLSQKAAATILGRVAEYSPKPFVAAAIEQVADADLRAAGLSGNKVKYVRNLAAADAAGQLDKNVLRRLPDEEIIERLSAISGIGRWTVEMFLMFCLRRADVLSLGDAGLRRAAGNLYGGRYRGDEAAVLEKAARRWRPWRTVACWYLWRSLG